MRRIVVLILLCLAVGMPATALDSTTGNREPAALETSRDKTVHLDSLSNQDVLSDSIRVHLRESPRMTESKSAYSPLQYLFGLIVVFALLIAMVWFVKKYGRRPRFISRLDENARVLDVCVIDTRHSLVIVRILDEILVLGTTPDNITLLFKITDPARVEEISSSAGKPGDEAFKSIFERFKRSK